MLRPFVPLAIFVNFGCGSWKLLPSPQDYWSHVWGPNKIMKVTNCSDDPADHGCLTIDGRWGRQKRNYAGHQGGGVTFRPAQSFVHPFLLRTDLYLNVHVNWKCQRDCLLARELRLSWRWTNCNCLKWRVLKCWLNVIQVWFLSGIKCTFIFYLREAS